MNTETLKELLELWVQDGSAATLSFPDWISAKQTQGVIVFAGAGA